MLINDGLGWWRIYASLRLNELLCSPILNQNLSFNQRSVEYVCVSSGQFRDQGKEWFKSMCDDKWRWIFWSILVQVMGCCSRQYHATIWTNVDLSLIRCSGIRNKHLSHESQKNSLKNTYYGPSYNPNNLLPRQAHTWYKVESRMDIDYLCYT